MREVLSYTDRDQIRKEERFRNGTSVGTTQFTYDQNGQVTNLVLSNVIDGASNTINVTTYIYDVAGRLTEQTNDSSYNPIKRDFGNNQSSSNYVNGIKENNPSPGDRQLTQIGFRSNTLLFEVGPGNQVLNDGTWKYVYNKEGTLQRKYKDGGETWDYTYDNANRLLSISVYDKPDADRKVQWTVNYKYDALGNLVSRNYATFTYPSGGSGAELDQSTINYYVVDQRGNSVLDLDVSQAAQTYYLRGTSQDTVFAAASVSGERSGTGLWYLSDQLGTVQMVANAFGVVVDSYAYNSLGVVTAEAAPSLKDPYRYLGQFTDTASALVFVNGQWSDPGLGRTLKQDPLSFQTRDRQLQQFVSASITGSNFIVWLTHDGLLRDLQGDYGLESLASQVQGRSTKLGQLNTEASGVQWAGVTVQNYAWGAFDALTAGSTKEARQGLAADLVDYSSTEYTLGHYTGDAIILGAQIAAAVATSGASAGAGATSTTANVFGWSARTVMAVRVGVAATTTVGGFVYGGLTGTEGLDGWDWSKAWQGGISGALVGAGVVGLSLGANAAAVIASNTAISAGMSGFGSLQRGQSADWATWGKASAIGAATGLVSGAVGFGLGKLIAPGFLGSAAIGGLSNGAGNLTSQVLSQTLGMGEPQSWSDFWTSEHTWESLGASVLGGAFGGALSHGMTSHLIRSNGSIMSDRMLDWYVGHAVAGGLGGFVGDALEQTVQMQAHPEMSWNWGQSLQATVLGAITSVASAAGQWSSFHACYAEGTLLDIPTGRKRIELFQEDDDILTRDEMDASAPVVTSKVVKIMRRLGRVWELRMQGTGPIRTTGEHPYYRQGDGWVACNVLKEGDLLHCRDGQWRRVAGVRDTGEITTVYNVTVDRYHTYFVSGVDWGFSVWAHNKCTDAELLQKEAIYAEEAPANERSPLTDPALRTVPEELTHQRRAAYPKTDEFQRRMNDRYGIGLGFEENVAAAGMSKEAYLKLRGVDKLIGVDERRILAERMYGEFRDFHEARERYALGSQDHHAVPYENSQYPHYDHDLVVLASGSTDSAVRSAYLENLPENLGPVIGHNGRHWPPYHEAVAARLETAYLRLAAEGNLTQAAAGSALGGVIRGIWQDIGRGQLPLYPDRTVALQPGHQYW